MNRLVWGLFAATLCACSEPSESPPPVPTSRSNAVAVTGKPQATTPPKPVASVAPPKATPRALCAQRVDFPAPKGLTTARAAAGTPAPSGEPAFGVGKWVWINLWAAWCGPCKEEMPRLLAFREKLRASGVLVDLAFVSLDDDERQFTRFLDAQPQGGVRASYWLPEGSGRSGFLGGLGLKDSVELPVQIFVSPAGRTTCVAQGAIEETDYPSLATLLGAR